MSVAGLCSICEREEAKFSCSRCGAVVCDLHHDRARGLCVDCAASIPRDESI